MGNEKGTKIIKINIRFARREVRFNIGRTEEVVERIKTRAKGKEKSLKILD